MVDQIKNPNAPSASQKLRALEKQLKELQGFMGQLVNSVNQTLNQQVGPLLGRLNDVEEILSVLVEDYGAEEVNAAIAGRRAKKLEGDIATAKANIADGVAKGFLIPSEVVTEKSLVVGFESDANDVPQNPPWASLLFAQLREDLKPTFVGAAVGTKVANGSGFFNITEIYVVDEERAREAATQPPAVESGLPEGAEAPTPPAAA